MEKKAWYKTFTLLFYSFMSQTTISLYFVLFPFQSKNKKLNAKPWPLYKCFVVTGLNKYYYLYQNTIHGSNIHTYNTYRYKYSNNTKNKKKFRTKHEKAIQWKLDSKEKKTRQRIKKTNMDNGMVYNCMTIQK